MKNYPFFFFAGLFMIGTIIYITGCTSTRPSKFYILSSIAEQEAIPKVNVTIGIDSVKIPDYLDRPQIVTQKNRNELNINEFNRWAGSLKENIALVLAENISLLLSTKRVFVDPGFSADYIDHWIHLEIIRLDGMPGDKVTMKALWTISEKEIKKETITKISEYTENLSDSSYKTMVAAMSRTFERLSREIASDIIELN